MVSILIEETGEYLDLQREFVGLNYQIYDLGNIDTRTGTFSNDFKIPNTAHNRAALGNATQSNILQGTLTPYSGITARCFQNNISISKGYIQINDTDKNTIDITFYGDNVDIFELIRDKSIRDVDLTSLRHVYDAATVISSFSNTSGYIYLVSDYGLFTERITNDIVSGEIFPSIFFMDVLTAMFKDIGYKIDGTLLNRALLKKSVLPFVNHTFGFSSEFVNSKSFYVNNGQIGPIVGNTFTIASGATVIHQFSGYGGGSLGAGYDNDLFNLTTDRYTADADYQITVRYLCDFRNFSDMNGPGVARPTFYVRKNGIVVATSAAGFMGVTYTATMEAGDYLEFYVRNNHGSTITFNGTATGTVSQTFVDGSIVYPETVLPDISQVDFLKFILFRFQGVLTVDQFTKTVYLNQFNDIKNKPTEDWGSKVDLAENPVTNYSSILKSYGKTNIAKFTEDDNDSYQEEYNSNNTYPFGSGRFTISNAFLEEEKTIFETPFSPTFIIESFDDNKLLIPYLPRFLDPADTTQINVPEPRMLTVYGKVDITDINQGLTSLDILGTNVTEIPFAYFYKSTFGFEVDDFKESMAFGVQNIPNANDLGAFESDYLYLIEILQNPEIKRAYLRLNQIDMVNLDFLKKKYFERFGGYFYLNIIENYDASGDSVECEIIKI
jgi:hypothetical protein